MMRAALWRPAVLLAAFAAVGASLLAGVQHLTAERIQQQREGGLLRTINEIVPSNSYDNDLLHDAITLSDPALGPEARLPAWRARRDGQPEAIIMTVLAPDGYGGPIRLLVGIAADGRLLGVRTLAHHETPNLGDDIDLTRSPWILSFEGHSLEDPQPAGWAVQRDGGMFDQFSGATITPRAVVRAVHRALIYFKAQRDKLFSAPTSNP